MLSCFAFLTTASGYTYDCTTHTLTHKPSTDGHVSGYNALQLSVSLRDYKPAYRGMRPALMMALMAS